MVKNKRMAVGITVAAVLLILVIARYSYENHLLARKEIETKSELYKISLSIANEKESILKQLEHLDTKLNALKAGILRADRVPVAAAELQKLIKGMAKGRQIKMSSEKVLPAIESGKFVRVPVEFRFKTMLPGLKGLIYDIDSSSLILSIPALKIKAPEMKGQQRNKVTLVVEGIMKQDGR